MSSKRRSSNRLRKNNTNDSDDDDKKKNNERTTLKGGFGQRSSCERTHPHRHHHHRAKKKMKKNKSGERVEEELISGRSRDMVDLFIYIHTKVHTVCYTRISTISNQKIFLTINYVQNCTHHVLHVQYEGTYIYDQSYNMYVVPMCVKCK